MNVQDKKALEKESISKGEIDLLLLVKQVWEGRKIIIYSIGIFSIIGLFIALVSKNEYTASSTMVPQVANTSSRLGGLSSLASIAGFNLDMNTNGNELSPVLYPEIVKSTSFQLEIMNVLYSFEELDEKVSLYDYYTIYYKPGILSLIRKYTIGLPGVISKAVKGKKDNTGSTFSADSEVIKITFDQELIRRVIQEHLSLSINDKEGYLTMESRFPQASLAAQVAVNAQNLLQQRIIDFKIEKSKAQLEFIEGRYNEAKKDYELTQSKLASFRDLNRNIASAVAQTELEKIENEYQLAFEVFSELAKQLEQARIQVKEDTPVFSVIKEVVVPIEKSKPQRAVILATWIFIGAFLGVGFVFVQKQSGNIKKRWNRL
jgi:hypothetical protein